MRNFSAEERAYIWLDAFPLSLSVKNALIAAAGGAVNFIKNRAEIFQNTVKADESGVYNDMTRSLQDDTFYKNLLSSLDREGITPIPRISDGFFEEWREAENPPLVQYEKGNAALKKREKFVIVGSRRTPPETMKRTQSVAEEISGAFTVVTGNADGGDSAALAGAAKGKGGISVLAGGFCCLESMGSAKCDFEKNLYVTEHTYSVAARKFSYERRNMMLAALGKGGLIVSAGEKSGALITAEFLKSAKKPLFAFPYSPESAAGRGCNALIKNGAYLAENARDIFEKLGYPSAFQEGAQGEEKTAKLTDDEKKIYAALESAGKANINALAHVTGLPVWKLSGVIAAMEVKGVLMRTGGNFVSLV